MNQLDLPFPKMHLALWDSRPRFLGMFQVYRINDAEASVKIPTVGVIDHLTTCNCGTPGAPAHPNFLCAAVYIKLGSVIFSVSWPTWFPL
jgi:hypothetical protein